LIKYQKGLEPVNLPHEQLNPIIGSTGVKAPSGPIVESVKQLEKKTPHMTTTIFASIEQIVEEAIVAIKKGNITKIGYLMNQNQALLKQLGVSSNILDEMINAALNAGALGAKLSGAGIGDNMIALSDENKQEAIITALNKTAGQALPECKIDPQGIILSKEL
ncbi:MAG: hypothetical protein U9O98_08550, partial [Asgard group archaeon]|nr:hypothetical protein [Asgard group archaeon]